MSDRPWLENIKVGDEVAVSYYSGYQFLKVVRATKTKIEVQSQGTATMTFRRKDGTQMGDYPSRNVYLAENTQELKDLIAAEKHRRELEREFEKYPARNLTTEQLEKIVAIMKGNSCE